MVSLCFITKIKAIDNKKRFCHSTQWELADLLCKDSNRSLWCFGSHVLRREARSPNASIWQQIICGIGWTTKRGENVQWEGKVKENYSNLRKSDGSNEYKMLGSD